MMSSPGLPRSKNWEKGLALDPFRNSVQRWEFPRPEHRAKSIFRTLLRRYYASYLKAPACRSWRNHSILTMSQVVFVCFWMAFITLCTARCTRRLKSIDTTPSGWSLASHECTERTTTKLGGTRASGSAVGNMHGSQQERPALDAG